MKRRGCPTPRDSPLARQTRTTGAIEILATAPYRFRDRILPALEEMARTHADEKTREKARKEAAAFAKRRPPPPIPAR